MSVQADILPPRYREVELVAHGGMGDIYRARDETLGRTVAVKVLADRYAADEEVRHRFTREGLAAARLSAEPTVVTIYDVGEWNDRPFIVMEYLEGGSLEAVLRERGGVPPARALAWLEAAARAIDAAHAHGIVHRDVKPGNLLLDAAGGVHVADFGIASAAGLDSLTRTGTVLGTAGYLAPEQAHGERVTPASDRYAFAVVAFELLAGRRPFESDSPTAEAVGHVQAPVPPISELSPSLPRELDPVFERALAKEPGERYPTCADFVAALRAAFAAHAATTERRAAAPAPAASVTTARPEARRARRRTLLPFLLVGLLAAGLAGVALAALVAGGDDGERAAPTRPSTVKVTVTTPGHTSTVTVERTTPAPAPAPPPPQTESSGRGTRGEDLARGRALTDQATGLMRAGNYAAALPIALQALKLLEGSGDLYEGYANYDVGKSLAELGQCDEALPYLERREQFGPSADVTAAKRKCGA